MCLAVTAGRIDGAGADDELTAASLGAAVLAAGVGPAIASLSILARAWLNESRSEVFTVCGRVALVDGPGIWTLGLGALVLGPAVLSPPTGILLAVALGGAMTGLSATNEILDAWYGTGLSSVMSTRNRPNSCSAGGMAHSADGIRCPALSGAYILRPPFLPHGPTDRLCLSSFFSTMSFLSAVRPSTAHALRTGARMPSMATREWSSKAGRASFARTQRPSPSAPPRLARPLAWTTLTGASMLGFFTSASPREMLSTTDSGSILREASPVATMRQPYTMVFVSSSQLNVPRSQWQSWIMYFREAGYDCIDLNVELPHHRPDGETDEELLSKEIIGQVRLSSLQREPVVFLRDGEDKLLPSYLGTGGFFGRRGPMTGLVLLHPEAVEHTAKADWPNNTPILIVPQSEREAEAWKGAVDGVGRAAVLTDTWNEKEGVVKEVERWLRNAGL